MIRVIIKFLDEVYSLKTLVRYNNTPRIVNESNAEHMYFVSIIVHKLNEFYNFDENIAIKMALFHDIPEIHLSDVPHNTKEKFPDIGNAVSNNQVQASDMIDPTMTPFVELYEKQQTVESKIVRLADYLSVLQYTKYEADLGNIHMKRIHKATQPLVQKLMEELKSNETN